MFEKEDCWYHSGDLLKYDEWGFVYFVDRAGDSYRWKGENVSTNEVCEALGHCPAVAEANVYGVQVPHTDGRVGMASLLLDEGAPAPAPMAYGRGKDDGWQRVLPHRQRRWGAGRRRSRRWLRTWVSTCPRTHGRHSCACVSVRTKRQVRHPSCAEAAVRGVWSSRPQITTLPPRHTGTFKFQKFRFVQEGFSPAALREAGEADDLYFRHPQHGRFVLIDDDLYARICANEFRL